MKKFYISVPSFICLTAANAQSITTSHIPVANDSYMIHNIDTTSITSYGTAGASQTYNFTSIVVDTASATRTYVAPSTTSFASDFPNSDIALNDGGTYQFYSSGSNYQLDGIAMTGSVTATVKLTDPGVIFPSFPYSYPSSNYDTLSGTVTSSFGNGTVTGGITTTVDGTGTLNLPGGVSYSVTRVKMFTNLDIDLSFLVINQKETRYMFFASSSTSKFPILEVGSASIDSNPAEKFGILNSIGYVGMEENENSSSFNMFPNPAKKELYINLDSKATASSVEILSSVGQTVKAEKITGGDSINKVSLDGISAGVYFVRVSNGEISSVKKLIVE